MEASSLTRGMLDRARKRADAPPTPPEWGYRASLDEGGSFAGRWRGETTDPDHTDKDGNPRRIYLLWDDDGELCFERHYAALGREVDRVKPQVGDTVVLYRGQDYATQYDNPGRSYGLEAAPCSDPLPGEAPKPGGGPSNAIPFL